MLHPQSESLLPLTKDDISVAESMPSHTTRTSIQSNHRRLVREALIGLCLTLWCTFLSVVAAYLFGAIGVETLRHSHPAYIHVFTTKGSVVLLLGCTIISAALGFGGHALWAISHPHKPVELGGRWGHPLVGPVSLLAIVAGGFGPALGITLYPKQLVPLGYTAVFALKAYGVGLGVSAGFCAAVAVVIIVGSLVCGS
ncbi:hypothetical protein OH77DRAFT_856365 [Trametes cingulata]|nr:hypothetical protein OH77DRAFT_856365 [Trametes cingulata]